MKQATVIVLSYSKQCLFMYLIKFIAYLSQSIYRSLIFGSWFVFQCLRSASVGSKIVEFYGAGLGQLSMSDRISIANMSPEYGATVAFFPVDSICLDYLAQAG